MTQLQKIEKELKRVGLCPVVDMDDENPTITVKRKPTSKKFMFELVFSRKGKLINLIAGPSETSVAWFDVQYFSK